MKKEKQVPIPPTTKTLPATTKQERLLSTENELLSSEAKKPPKWYAFQQKKQYRQARLQELMIEYDKSAKLLEKKEILTKEDRQKYVKEIQKLNNKQLSIIGTLKPQNVAYTIGDKWNKVDHRNSMILRIYYKSRSSTDYMICKHTRLIEFGRCVYLFPPNGGIYDTKHKKIVFSYYEGNPFPIEYLDDFQSGDNRGNTFPDGMLLKKSIKFEFAQKLAASEMSKKMDLTFIFSIITMGLSAIILILCVKGFKLI